LGEKEDNFVIEGRTSWYLIPHSLKIYLDVAPEEGARRIFSSLQRKGQERNEGKGLDSVAAVLASNQARMASDELRYRQYYGIDVYDRNNYDFYLDTTDLTPEEVFQRVFDSVQPRLDRTKN